MNISTGLKSTVKQRKKLLL